MRFVGLLYLFIFIASASGALAQAPAPNPFDILSRLPKKMRQLVATGTVEADSVGNPFNMVPHRAPGASKGISESVERVFRPLEALPKGDALSDTFLFWLLVAMVAFLSVAVATQRNIVVKAWRGFLNDSALTLAQREASGFTGSTPYFLLYASFLLNAGTFIFLIARFFNPRTLNNLGFLAICIVLSGVLFLAKHAILGFIAWIFPVVQEVRRYNFLIIVFNCILGLFLIPFNFLVAFVHNYTDFLVFWTLGLAALFYAYRFFRAGAVGGKFLSGHVFHFLLYLCTVEIAPVFILIKLAMLASK